MNLYTAVISLSLVAASSMIAANYISPESKLTSITKKYVHSGYGDFKSAVKIYEEINKQFVWVEDCPPGAPSGDPSCVYDRKVDPNNDGKVNADSWEADLTPEYMVLPPLPDRFVWTMHEDIEGLYVCLTTNADKLGKNALAITRKSFPSSVAATRDACDSSSSMSESEALNYSGPSISLTLRI